MSFINLTKQAGTPSTPAANVATLFVNSNRQLSMIDDTAKVEVLSLRSETNLVRNSGFWFAQRQNPTAATTYSNTTGRSISADGWGITNENTSVQYIRTDTVAAVESGLQNQYYGTFSKITNTGKIIVSQVIEARDTLAHRVDNMRLQVYLKASSSQTMKIALVQNNSSATADTIAATFISAFGANGVDPTLGTNLAYLTPLAGGVDNCTAGANAFTCSVTTAWQRFGGVVAIPTNLRNLIVMIWTDTQFAAATSFSVSQVSVTDGYEYQEWVPLPYQTELDRVQRYYQKTFALDTAPAQNAGVGGALRGMVAIAGAVATSSTMQWRFPTPLRVAPVTTTFYNPSAANAFTRNVPAATDATATSAANTTADQIDVNATGLAGWTVGQELKVHCSVDAEI